MRMRSAAEPVGGNEAMIPGAPAAQAAFPDRERLAGDVIWSGEEQYGREGGGHLPSHRVLITGTRTGTAPSARPGAPRST